MTGTRKARAGWIGSAALLALLLAAWLITLPPLMPSYAQTRAAWKPSESWLYDRNGELLDSIRVDFRARRLDWVPAVAIPVALRRAVINSEDRRFADHGGVDWLAIGGAIRARFSKRSSRGASTISMQVAAFLAPELAKPGGRSFRLKIRQMRAALALESSWSKDEILEAYLNLAGFRGENQGLGAAAVSLFGKAPSALEGNESILLAALLPAPGASGEAIARRACAIAKRRSCADLRSAALHLASGQGSRSVDPGLAPHLSVKLLTRPGMKQRTTLDRHLQTAASSALRRQLSLLGAPRARDGAVVVVDNASGDVLAYVGGVGGDSTAAAVDGADALRQAGSTLKPFLYAQAMEKGYLTAASILDDSPVQLDTASGLYVPQNYDKGFKGPVSARTALASSLNVPAVRALQIVGTESFRDRLWDIGYRGLTEAGDYYGFSLALGSAEVTLMEQAAAYRSLALGGRWSPLRLRSEDGRAETRVVTTPQAAWLVGNILSDPQARETSFGLDSALRLPFWAAVKTGTSKALRDNWCVGYSDRYTVAVWVGNLEGDSMHAVSGTSGAAPIWRDVMLALHQRQPGREPAMPRGIEQRSVRFTAGLESSRREFFITGTGQNQLAQAPLAARRPRIANPVSGAVFALDPDIPPARQRMGVLVTGETQGHRLMLDKRDLGEAGSKPQIVVGPGTHAIALVNAEGKQVDRVVFTMR